MTSDGSDLFLSRLILAPRRAVWRAWSEREEFETWWIPAPIECRAVKLDLRPGGGFETLMREEGSSEFQPHVEGCFLDVVPEERLVFTTCLTEGWRPAKPWLALTAIFTLASEDGGTRYTATAMHRDAAGAEKHEEMGFYPGWNSTIDQLAAAAERLAREG